jgi:hypothetical protein
MYSQTQTTTPSTYTYTNNSITFTKYPSYWIRKNVRAGGLLCDPCPETVTDKYE